MNLIHVSSPTASRGEDGSCWHSLRSGVNGGSRCHTGVSCLDGCVISGSFQKSGAPIETQHSRALVIRKPTKQEPIYIYIHTHISVYGICIHTCISYMYMHMHVSIFLLSISLSIYLFICPSSFLSINTPVYVPKDLPIYPCVFCPSIYVYNTICYATYNTTFNTQYTVHSIYRIQYRIHNLQYRTVQDNT